MKLVPLGDRVVLKQLVAEETTNQESYSWSGKGKTTAGRSNCCRTWRSVDGKEVTMNVAVGDKVIYSKYAGTEVELMEKSTLS